MINKIKYFLQIFSLLSGIVLVLVLGVACGSHNTQHSEQSSSLSNLETSEVTTCTPTPVIEDVSMTIEQVFEKENLIVVPGLANTVVLGSTGIADIEGDLASVEYSNNKSKVAMLFETHGSEENYLVFFDGVSAQDIASDVVSFRISGDGSAIAYLSDSNEKRELYIYQCDSGESTLVSESAGPLFALSPNGHAIAFMQYTKSGSEEKWTLISYVLGEDQVPLGESMYPVALTDDGMLVYAINLRTNETHKVANADFVVYNQGNPVTLSVSFYNLTSWLYFNRDCTEVLFSDEAGILISQNGDEAIALESDVCLSDLSYAVKADESYFEEVPTFEYLSFRTAYSGTETLNNLLLAIRNQNSVGGYLWCVLEENKGVRLTKIQDDCRYDQAGSSILANNWMNEEDVLIYIESISDSLTSSGYNPDSEKHIIPYVAMDYLLSSSQTIYYDSGRGPEDNRINGARTDEMSAIYSGTDTKPVCISASGVWMDKFSREGEPDIIYYLEYTEPESFDNENEYISWFYYDLYMIEDVSGAVPVLIAENVGEFGCGEYGVYYLALNQVSPEIVMHFRDDPNDLFYSDPDHPSEADISDRNDLYYSADGTTFTQVATIEKQYWFGG